MVEPVHSNLDRARKESRRSGWGEVHSRVAEQRWGVENHARDQQRPRGREVKDHRGPGLQHSQFQ